MILRSRAEQCICFSRKLVHRYIEYIRYLGSHFRRRSNLITFVAAYDISRNRTYGQDQLWHQYRHRPRCHQTLDGRHATDERAIRFSPRSKFYTVEISTLYFIDRIAYGVYTDYYSPAPVLYDNEDKIEINNCPEKVKLVFLEYKKWFEECIKIRKDSKVFSF
jgi:hypothetical protein